MGAKMEPLKNLERVFPERDRETVRAAVAAAERAVGAEIVTVLTGASNEYHGALWKAATIGALAGSALAAVAANLTGRWGVPAWALAIPSAAGAILLAGAAEIAPALKRLFAGAATLEAAARSRAESAFLHHEVFRAPDRTGVLVFVSLFERRVVILADQGIHVRVGEDEWRRVAEAAAAQVRGGAIAEAFTGVVARIAELLREHGFARAGGQENALEDRPHVTPL